MITLEKIEDLTPTVISHIIKSYEATELPRLEKLIRYYNNKNDIKNRVNEDLSKPNNKVANAYASYITDTLVGYFVGKPITYNSNDEALLEKINKIFEYADEDDENTELAKDASICGVAFERVYLDSDDKAIKFKRINPLGVIPIYDKTIEENLLAIIRYYKDFSYVDNTTVINIEVIGPDTITTYKADELLTGLTLIENEDHHFSAVPVVVYENNSDRTGDFEKVIDLIDAYDKMESDSLNDFEYFVDAYLALYGFTAEPEDIRKMKVNRVLLMDEGTKAEWLTKNENDSVVENIKDRLDQDIHKFAKCPNLSDEEFASNASGVAIKFKLLGTENLVSIKERKFKKGLQDRLRLIANMQSLVDENFDWRNLDIIFTRNIPSNDADIADVINKLHNIVSEKTLLAQVPFVEDVNEEISNLESEREKEKAQNPFLQSREIYLTNAMQRSQQDAEVTSDKKE